MLNPVNTLLVLRDEYYYYTGNTPNWERLAYILHVPNDKALCDHVAQLAMQSYGSTWAKHFLLSEHRFQTQEEADRIRQNASRFDFEEGDK